MTLSIKTVLKATGSIFMIAAFAAGQPVCAQQTAGSYPTRAVKMIVPFPPAGPTDQLARLVAERLSKSLKVTVVVENRAGAGGTIGANMAAHAAPDGYTILFGNSSALAGAPNIYKSLPYDPLTSFVPISVVSRGTMVMVVNSAVPAKTLGEFIALAKSKPGQLNFGSAGVGSPLHIGGEMLNELAGINVVHVPYQGGGPSLNALLANEVQMAFDLPPTLLQHIKAGSIRALAVAGPKRLASLPDVPTAAEAGLKGLELNLFTALVAPAGTPAPIIDKLNRVTQKILQEPDVKAAMSLQGFDDADPSTPEQAKAFLKNQLVEWAHFSKIAKIKADK